MQRTITALLMMCLLAAVPLHTGCSSKGKRAADQPANPYFVKQSASTAMSQAREILYQSKKAEIYDPASAKATDRGSYWRVTFSPRKGQSAWFNYSVEIAK